LALTVNSNTGQDSFNLCLGEFGEVGDSEEELADPIQQGESIISNLFIVDHDQSPTPIIAMAAISDFPFRHLTLLLLFPFYNPDTINLDVLMVLSIRGIVNARLLPVAVIFKICS
jgi:hypothetical protein